VIIDVWLIMLIYANGGALQNSAEKILKSKILQILQLQSDIAFSEW
jgi:hypothetical protein